MADTTGRTLAATLWIGTGVSILKLPRSETIPSKTSTDCIAMQPTNKEILIVRAAALSRTAPEEWRKFMEALAVLSEQHRENLVKSPMPELPVNQGRAQAVSSLIEMFTDCEAVAEKIRNKPNVKI